MSPVALSKNHQHYKGLGSVQSIEVLRKLHRLVRQIFVGYWAYFCSGPKWPGHPKRVAHLCCGLIDPEHWKGVSGIAQYRWPEGLATMRQPTRAQRMEKFMQNRRGFNHSPSGCPGSKMGLIIEGKYSQFGMVELASKT